MRGAPFTFVLVLLALAGPALAKARPGYTHGVANAALVAAAKATPLKLIDYDEVLCRNDRTVEAWLKELTAGDAKAIVWTGGPCELVGPDGIDTGSDWCAQAAILLKHPRNRQDRPMVGDLFRHSDPRPPEPGLRLPRHARRRGPGPLPGRLRERLAGALSRQRLQDQLPGRRPVGRVQVRPRAGARPRPG
jgi:hypothetical protein